MPKKTALIILDGWGIGTKAEVDAIQCSDTPFYDHLIKTYPNATLKTFGEEVGLPEGQMGNSEVGHLNIGAGRIVYQELARINKAVDEGTLENTEVLKSAIDYAIKHNKAIHLLGLVSDGGVHSHIDHLKALCTIFRQQNLPSVYVHAFLDGRDTDPRSGMDFIKDLEKSLQNTNCELATIIGRYYAMDRDTRWERTQKAYKLLVHGIGEQYDSAERALIDSYNQGITDEFVQPILLKKNGTIKEGDVVLFYNFRTDRPRQLVRALSQEDFPEYDMKSLNLFFVTMTNYNKRFKGIKVIYEKDQLKNTLGEIVANHGLKQVRIAETEKYPHVTFFFNGGREEAYQGEERILIPSPKVATYDLQPEMSAVEVTEAICDKIRNEDIHFICLNYANADMVGHTGDFEAAQKACMTVDRCMKQVVELALEKDFHIIIIADHGNSDLMINEDGSPNTAHTTNLVPVIYVAANSEAWTINDGKLADIAPTILSILNLSLPEEMTGNNLLTFNEL